MSLTAIALRVLFTYLFMLVLLRLSGKRTVAQGTPFDFVVALILGDMLDDVYWAEVPVSQFVVGAGVVMLAHLSVSCIGFVSPAFSRWVAGVPCEIVREGELCPDGMRQERVSPHDVMMELRQDSIDDMREIRSLTIETSGLPGVLFREWAKKAQKRDLDRVRAAQEEAQE